MSQATAEETKAAIGGDPALAAKLATFVGQGAQREGFLSRAPIDPAVIRQMTDAVGDRNPIYTDEAFARATRHQGLVVPPLWLNSWLMHGLKHEDEETTLEDGTAYFHLAPSGQRRAPQATRTIRDELNDVFGAYGYTSPAVTNISHSYLRYLRPGERPRFSSWIIDQITGPKATKLGEAYFVQQHMDVFVSEEQVATIRQRYIRSKPAARQGDAKAASTGNTPAAMPADAGDPPLRRVTPRPRTETVDFAEVRVGDALPTLMVKISPTLIVAGALASQDFQDVHHDYLIMPRRGHPHIFMNMMTTSGLLGRYVTDWSGPEAIIRDYEMRLMRPNYPGDTMRLTGTVGEITATGTGGLVTVDLLGTNSLGTHTKATVVVDLPTR